jgi:hypothetical protein
MQSLAHCVLCPLALREVVSHTSKLRSSATRQPYVKTPIVLFVQPLPENIQHILRLFPSALQFIHAEQFCTSTGSIFFVAFFLNDSDVRPFGLPNCSSVHANAFACMPLIQQLAKRATQVCWNPPDLRRVLL